MKTNGLIPWDLSELVAHNQAVINFRSKMNGKIFSLELVGPDSHYRLTEIVEAEPENTQPIYEGTNDSSVQQAILTAVMQA